MLLEELKAARDAARIFPKSYSNQWQTEPNNDGNIFD